MLLKWKNKKKLVILKKIIKKQKMEIFQLKSIIDNLPGDIYWKNKDGIYSGINVTGSESLRKMGLMWKITDVLGKTDHDIYDKKTADVFREHDLEVMRTGVGLTKEETAILPSGEKKGQLSNKLPLRDSKGKIVGIVGNTVDISALKKIEGGLRQAAKIEMELRQAVMILTGSIVHDLRTPLCILNMKIDTLKKYLPALIDAYNKAKNANLILNNQFPQSKSKNENLLKSLGETAQFIQEETRNMHEFINITLKTLSKTLIGELTQSDLVNCSLWHCISNTLQRYPFSEEERQYVQWDQNYTFEFKGNEVLMIRVLSNLLSNSLNQIKNNPNGKIFISAEDGKIVNIVRFKDTAGGALPEIMAHMFEGFHTNKKEGTGVGLASCKLIMKSFGGDITCDSNYGDSIEFILTFPKMLIIE